MGVKGNNIHALVTVFKLQLVNRMEMCATEWMCMFVCEFYMEVCSEGVVISPQLAQNKIRQTEQNTRHRHKICSTLSPPRTSRQAQLRSTLYHSGNIQLKQNSTMTWHKNNNLLSSLVLMDLLPLTGGRPHTMLEKNVTDLCY